MSVPTLENKLEEFLVNGHHKECPVVRLKTQNIDNNPTGERVLLIRRNPLATALEYRRAAITAGHLSLTQWVEAGVGDAYPESLRTYAERDMVRETMARIRRENKPVRNDSIHYREAREQLRKEEVGSLSHKRAANRVEYYRKKVYLGNKLISTHRLIHLEDLLTNGIVTTTDGLTAMYVAQVAALLDMLPLKKLREVDSNVRKELNDSRDELRDPQPNVLSRLLSVKSVMMKDVDDETYFTLQRLYRIVEKLSVIRQVVSNPYPMLQERLYRTMKK